MAISINQQQTRIDPPEVQLTGQRVRDVSTSGDYGGNDDIDLVTTMEEVTETGGTVVRKREVLVYRGTVRMELVPDTNFSTTNYSNRVARAGEFVGVAGMNKLAVNQTSETYYTLNGKDPSRTKANLWTGQPIDLRHNKSGTDNTIIKARSYINGLVSKVMKVEIRIIRPHDNTF